MMMRKAMLSAAACAVALGAMTGCSGGDDTEQPKETASTSSVQVDQEAFAKAMDQLVYGGSTTSEDGGECFAQAAKDAGLSAKGQQVIIDMNSDDWGEVAQGVTKRAGSADGKLFSDGDIREGVDACVDEQMNSDVATDEKASGSEKSSDSKDSETEGSKKKDSPKDAKSSEKKEKKAKPNLTPKYKIPDDEEITTTDQIQPGLISMFSSYTSDKTQKEIFEKNGKCLSQAVLDAGLSQKSLRFIAGGAPLKNGSVADNLPVKKDREIWVSDDFVSSMAACTQG